MPKVLTGVPQLTFDDIAPSPPPVARLGGYELGASLAPGIWLARLADDTAPNAVARLLDPAHVNRRTLERFAHDAVQLRRIDHPGAAKILDAGIVALPDGPAPYLVEERVTGDALMDHTEPMGLRGRLYLLAALAETLHAAHLKGIVHRDLRTGRVLIDHSGRLRVRGLGVAHVTNDDVRAFASSARASAERVATLAPEQATGAYAAIDARADVYALGVLGYQMLTRRAPYDLRGGARDAARVIKSEAPAPMDLGRDPLARDAEAILARALRKRPEARHQSASEFAADLTRALAGEPHTSRSTPARQHLRLAAKRHPVVPAAAAALLVFTAVGAGLLGTALSPRQAAPGPRVFEPSTSPAPRAALVAQTVPDATPRMQASSRLGRAQAAAAEGRPAAAESMLRRMIERARTPQERAAAQRALAELFIRTDRRADAEPLALEALTRTLDELGPDSPSARACYRTLARVLEPTTRRGQEHQWWSLLAGAPAPSAI